MQDDTEPAGAPGEMLRRMAWPFPDGQFPPQLGAVVQRTVLSGRAPARLVQHDQDGSWSVGDGTDPNAPGAVVATHLRHVLERNSSVAALADLPPGWFAVREGPGAPWLREELVEDD